MRSLFEGLRLFINRLPPAQRVVIAGVFVGGVLLLAAVGYWASRPDYSLLFARLGPSDAGQIVDALRDDGIRYQLREGGSAVYVPREKVYDLRLRFAAQSIGADSPAGYELFDQGSLGMTDFMQKLNLKRALEGELSRTISSMRPVEVARVHLVTPERSPFREARNEPSASVVIRFAGSARLSAAQIEGIGGLVAGAVEGLTSDRVTVLDTRGNVLSSAGSGNADLALSSTQLRVTKALEDHLAQKGQSMLDQFLGPGNAIVRVAALLDFNKTVSEVDRIDPESATIISEQRLDEQGGDESANSTMRNYEMTRTRERQEKSAYDITEISVSLVLNQPVSEDPESEAITRSEYSPEELQQIEEVVKSAVGFDGQRGDQFAVHQSPFDTSSQDQLTQDIAAAGRSRLIQNIARYAVMLIALFAGIWFLRGSLTTVTRMGTEMAERALEEAKIAAAQLEQVNTSDAGNKQVDQAAGATAALPSGDLYTSKLSPEAQARLQAKNVVFDEIIESVGENPDDAADLLRTWVAEDRQNESATT